MRTQKVVVLPYDKQWKQDFLDIKKELADALEDLYISIEHVGSTSVEGLAAKPIIDIDVVMRENVSLETIVQRLLLIGYHHEGNLGIEGREAFKYSGKPHLRTHHLYVCPHDSKELKRHLIFRDYLKTYPDDRETYSLVKYTAAKLFPEDIDKYIEYKSPCIEEIYKKCGLMS